VRSADAGSLADAVDVEGGVETAGRVLASEWIERYPLGPLSTGQGFGIHAIRAWESLSIGQGWRLAADLGLRRWGREARPPFAVWTLDGAVGCVSSAMIVDAIRARPLARCNAEGRAASVVMRAVVTPAGWIAPLEASVRPEDRALAECVAGALFADGGLPHAAREGVETVFVARWR
jgi:hypothetical protein